MRCPKLYAITTAMLLAVSLSAGSRWAAAEAISPAELEMIRQAEAARIEVVERVYGSVVCIYGNNRQGGGSGVLFDPRGFALTNHHVIAGAGTSGWGGLADGNLYRWRLIGTDPGGDVAIIQLTGLEEFPAARLGNSDHVRAGDFVLAMGNPFVLAEDQRPTVTLGVVSGIERYQKGSGTNLLVYGNCIQVDTSINPGNSGGPLFNMQGEVIGINGRISLLERGRVNVGVGYAISMEQIKNFLPDLLATKIAQHGTLDAQFSNRAEGVICDALNLDSPAARAGLRLGDRLLEFEGQAIRNANTLTNLVSTLPTDWPAHLVVERDGERFEFHVRLTPLPYVLQKPKAAAEKPEPEPKPDEDEPPKEDPAPKDVNEKRDEAPENKESDENDAPEKDAPDEKDEEPGPDEQPKVVVRSPQLPLDDPNKIRDAKINAENALWVVAQWKEFAGTAKEVPARVGFRLVDEVRRGGERIGEVTTTILTDSRWHVEYQVDGSKGSYTYNQGRYRDIEGAEISPDEALANPMLIQASALAAAFSAEPSNDRGRLQLQAGDKAQSQRAYLLRAGDAENAEWFLWLSLFASEGGREVRLLKAGSDVDSVATRPSVTFADYREVGGVQWPFSRAVVTGLSERVEYTLTAMACDILDAVPAPLAGENREDSNE